MRALRLRVVSCAILVALIFGIMLTPAKNVSADDIEEVQSEEILEEIDEFDLLEEQNFNKDERRTESDVGYEDILRQPFVGASLPLNIRKSVGTNETFYFSTDYPNTWANTGNQAYDIVQVAYTQLGYAELPGYGNHTKYNYWYYGADNWAPWCGIFACWCADQAGISSDIIPKYALTADSRNWMRDNAFYDDTFAITPQGGDLLFFHNGTRICHIAIVVDYDPETNKVTYIGGNQQVSGSIYGVTLRSCTWAKGTKTGDNTLAGYGRPNYVNTEPSYVLDSWNWMDEYSFATASFKNEINPEDIIEIAADVTRTPDHNKMVCTASVVFEGKEYTDTVEFDFAKVVARSLNLEGKITLNIKVSLPESVLANANSYAIVTFKGTSTKQFVRDVKSQKVDGETVYVFTQDVCAKEMRDPVKVEIFDGQGKRVTFFGKEYQSITSTGCVFSVQDYLDLAKEFQDQNLVKLALIMEKYGDAAQLFFNYNPNGIKMADEVMSVSANDLANYAARYEGELPGGIKKSTASLVLEADNTIKQYYELNEEFDISSFEFYVDGEKRDPVMDSKGKYYVQVQNVVAKELHEEHTFEVRNDTNHYIVHFSALSYAQRALTVSDDENLLYLVKAIYLYNKAARTYFNY